MKKVINGFVCALWAAFPAIACIGIVGLAIIGITHMRQDMERHERMMAVCRQIVGEKTAPMESRMDELSDILFSLNDSLGFRIKAMEIDKRPSINLVSGKVFNLSRGEIYVEAYDAVEEVLADETARKAALKADAERREILRRINLKKPGKNGT